MRKLLARLGVVVLLSFVGALACASSGGNAYYTAVQKYKADSVEYGIAGDQVAAAYASGRVTAAQRVRFDAAVADVQRLDSQVFADLNAWRMGDKPSGYDEHAAALFRAQMVVRDLAAEVK